MPSIKKMNLKKTLRENRFFFIFLFINLVAHWKLLLLNTQLAYGDFSPWPESVKQALYKFMFGWEEVGFGLSRQAGNPLSLLQGLILLVLRSPLLSQKVYIFFLPIVSYLSFDFLLKRYLGIKSGVSRFLASLFYTFSPVALGEFTGGSQFSTILVFSFLPLIYANTLKLLKKPTIRLIFLHGLLLGLFFSIYPHLILIYFLSLLALFICDMINTKFRAFKRWFKLVYTGIIAFFINPIALITSLNILYNTSSREQTRSFVDSTSQFLMEIHITYANILLTTVSRMGSIGAFDYQFEHFWTIPFYLVVLFVLYQVVSYHLKKRGADRLITISLLNYILIILFIFFTTLEWTFPIFRAIPVLYMFRNPSKLVYLSTFFFSIMFAFSLERFLKTKISKFYLVLFIIVVIVIQATYTWPTFVGDRGLANQREKYTIPIEQHKVLETVKLLRKNESDRTAWLPIGHDSTFIKLVWLDRNKLDAQIGIKEFGGAAFEHTVLESVYYAIFRGDQNAALNALSMAQVDYLIVFKEDFFYERGILNHDIIKSTLKGVPVIESTNFYDIYEIGTNFPLVYAPSNIYSSNVADSYHALSKIKNNDTFAIVPLGTARELKIEPDLLHLFAFSKSASPLITNVQWRENWYWDSPTVYPKSLGDLTPNTDTYSYLMDSLESIAEITEFLTSDKSVTNSEVTNLLNVYSRALNIFNLFIIKIPQNKVNSDMYSLLIRMYLYVDKSYIKLSEANLINETIASQYSTFMSNLAKFQSEKCQSDFCYNLTTYVDTNYQVEVFDVEKTNADKAIWIDGKEYRFLEYTDNNWINAGNVHFEAGEHHIELNLDQDYKAYEFDDENNTLIFNNDDDIKFNFTFLYDFEEDVYIDLYNMPTEVTRQTDKYLVWKGFLASSDSNNICYVKEDDKCYRLFVANLQPNNNYEGVRVTFYKDVSMDPNSRNTIKDISVKEQLNPALLLWNPQQISPRQKPDITYNKINPTKYEVNVENIQDDFILVFNQSFNNNWVLQTKDKKQISTDNHFKVNYYANAWYVKKADLDGKDGVALEIVFPPQKNLYFSLVVTVISVTTCLYFIFRKEPQSQPTR